MEENPKCDHDRIKKLKKNWKRSEKDLKKGLKNWKKIEKREISLNWKKIRKSPNGKEEKSPNRNKSPKRKGK